MLSILFYDLALALRIPHLKTYYLIDIQTFLSFLNTFSIFNMDVFALLIIQFLIRSIEQKQKTIDGLTAKPNNISNNCFMFCYIKETVRLDMN